MPDSITLYIDGEPLSVIDGITVAAAIAIRYSSGKIVTRRSVGGARRGPFCGMGVCQECRVDIDGVPHRLACQTLCSEGMRVETGAQP